MARTIKDPKHPQAAPRLPQHWHLPCCESVFLVRAPPIKGRG